MSATHIDNCTESGKKLAHYAKLGLDKMAGVSNRVKECGIMGGYSYDTGDEFC